MPICIMCQFDFEPTDSIFEQRLIEDTSFCSRCFKDILSESYDESLAFNLSKIRV